MFDGRGAPVATITRACSLSLALSLSLYLSLFLSISISRYIGDIRSQIDSPKTRGRSQKSFAAVPARNSKRKYNHACETGERRIPRRRMKVGQFSSGSRDNHPSRITRNASSTRRSDAFRNDVSGNVPPLVSPRNLVSLPLPPSFDVRSRIPRLLRFVQKRASRTGA
jgi:hypothetical protein